MNVKVVFLFWDTELRIPLFPLSILYFSFTGTTFRLDRPSGLSTENLRPDNYISMWYPSFRERGTEAVWFTLASGRQNKWSSVMAHEPAYTGSHHQGLVSPWKNCKLCSLQCKSSREFARHLREFHCSKEGGSYVCRYGPNNICPSLPLEGVSDMDYENHIARDHVQASSRKRSGIYMGFYSHPDNSQMYGYSCKIRYFLDNLNINVDNVLNIFFNIFQRHKIVILWWCLLRALFLLLSMTSTDGLFLTHKWTSLLLLMTLLESRERQTSSLKPGAKSSMRRCMFQNHAISQILIENILKNISTEFQRYSWKLSSLKNIEIVFVCFDFIIDVYELLIWLIQF